MTVQQHSLVASGTSRLPTAIELLEGTEEGVIVLDARWRFAYLNSAAVEQIDPERQLLGADFWESFPVARGTVIEEGYRRAMDHRETVAFQVDYAPLSSSYEVQVAPMASGGLVIRFRDVTARKERDVQFAQVFDQGIVGVVECGPNGRIRMANKRFCEIVGRSPEELSELGVRDFTHPDDWAWNGEVLDRHRDTAKPFQIEKRYLRPDGSIAWCRVSAAFVRGPSGAIESSITFAEEITEQKIAELALRETQQLYLNVLEASADCIMILDLEGKLLLMNSPGVHAMALVTFDAVRGRAWTSLWPEENAPLVEAAVAEAAAGDTARFSAYSPTPAGVRKWWDVVVTPMRSARGDIVRLLSISRDITEQRETAARLKWTSEHDPLTQLPNRRAFEGHLQAAIFRAMQTDGAVGLLLIDLDHFKHVNDTFGHAAGDHLLEELAVRLTRAVGSKAFVGRLGGDEFAIILEGDSNSAADLLGTGSSVLNALRDPISWHGQLINASASIGGACYPVHAKSANELLKSADIALYDLKRNGRGGTKLFEGQMKAEAELVAAQLNLARVALTDTSVEPYYQQKVDLRTGEIAGFEALLRWNHPKYGIQPPSTVSEAFGDYELATKIGGLMQTRVLHDVRTWLERSLSVGSVAINAAPAEFMRDDFAENMLARLRAFAVPPSMIELEVTEHVFFDHTAACVKRALYRLSDAGVRIALDDFGTGHSSLTHLREFPVDVLKIDRVFVEKIATDAEGRAIVSAVIGLARSLGIDVVAEGVENYEQLVAVKEEGCLLGQGFHFGRPVPSDEIPLLLSKSPSPGGPA